MRRFGTIALLVLSLAVLLSAQASRVTSSGTLPATPCADGNVYVKSGASPGWYVCDTATQLWVGPYPTSASGSGTVTNTGTLTDHALIVGNGGVDVSALAGLGTTTTVLHGNASADPAFSAVVLTTDVTGVLPRANGGVLAGAATVSTDETQTNNTGYGDLATSGPAVTLTTGTSAIIWLSSGAYRTLSAGSTALVSVDVSGATTVAASDTNCTFAASGGASFGTALSRVLIVTGLTAGSNTFTVKYKNDNTGSGIWHFTNRSIAVLAL